MFTFIVGVISSLAAGITAELLVRTPNPLKLLPRRTIIGYMYDLQQKIKEMPFIYKDLDGEVLNDFVDVEFQSLHLGSFKLEAVRKINNISDDEKLKRNSRVLFIGNAGIGKTTFQRRSILNLINSKLSLPGKRSKPNYLNDKESRIPIYVPLKAVDNSSPLPILRYILKSSPLFAHRNGIKKLLRFAQNCQLFLFLDGYDEIPFTGDGFNFVQQELELIIFPPAAYLTQIANINISNPHHRLFYQSLDRCRIWLSSRREFFEQNPIADLGTGFKRTPEGLVAVELKGIGNNRYRLAEKIFDKYRKRSSMYADILSEEYFLNDIDKLKDEDLKKFSFNPLFLTVMCYVYVKEAGKKKSYAVTWINNFEDLVINCIDLLLFELDEVKARDLPAGKKAALLDRRNAYFAEKKAFLMYFASQLFFDGKSIFTLDYLVSKADEFFTNEYHPENSRVIIRGLTSNDPKENIALQLTTQGVFVLVDKNEGIALYDFPHRRFREVLASNYIATPERYEMILANIDKKQFTELLKVFFESGGFKNQLFQEQSLVHILDKAKGKLNDDYYVRLTYHFMIRRPRDYDPSKVVERFLSDCLGHSIVFKISVKVLTAFHPDQIFQQNLAEAFYDSVAKKDINRLSLCCELLEFYNSPLHKELLRATLLEHIRDEQVFPVLLQHLLFNDQQLFFAMLEKIACYPKAFLHLNYIVSRYIQSEEGKRAEDFIHQFISVLSRPQKLNLFYFLYNYSAANYAKYKKRYIPEVDDRLFDYIGTVYDKSIPRTVNDDIQNYCIITDELISKLSESDNFKDSTVILYDDIVIEKPEDNVSDDEDAAPTKRLYFCLKPNDERVHNVIDDLQDLKYRSHSLDEFNKIVSRRVSKIGKQLRVPGYLGEYDSIGKECREAPQYSITEYENNISAFITTNAFYCCILTNESLKDAANNINQKCPIILSYVDKRKNKVYAHIDDLSAFTNEITSGLEIYKYRVLSLGEFEQKLDDLISNAIVNLTNVSKFRINLNTAGISQNRELSLKNFAKEIRLSMLRTSILPTTAVVEIQDAMSELPYTPPSLIKVFV